jgi:nucleoside-diphosphate-sugar epimerase
MSRVLVLGGTGAIGTYLCPELRDLHHEVHVTTREKQEDVNGGFRYVCGDARSRDFIKSLLSRGSYDVIIDLMAYSTAEFLDAHETLLGGTAQYIFISSYRVFADSGTEPINERSPRLLEACRDQDYLATDDYGLAKARQEDILKHSKRSNWTIVRPCITYSQKRFQFGTLEADTICYRALQGIPVIMARDILPKITTMTWAGDVARLISRLALNPEALCEDFNAVTAECRSWTEVADYYEEFIGLTRVEVNLDLYAMIVGGNYQIKYDRLYDRVLDNTKVLKVTGLKQSEFLGLKQGLRMELARFKRNPSFKTLDIRLQARMDKITRSRISLGRVGFRDKLRYYNELYGIGARVRTIVGRRPGARSDPSPTRSTPMHKK